MSMHSYTDLINNSRTCLSSDIPLSTFRLLRLIGIKEILGDSAGPTLYMTGKSVGKQIPVNTTEQFMDFIIDHRIGIPEIENIDENNIIVRVWECMTCSGLPNTGELLCHFESGLIAGAAENITGRRAKCTQTKGISHGDSYCQFELFFF
ncbi:MAG: hypothetical protein VR72_14325 [Clostridiaceae bacterium BRH_c20a]|nr:MAG: hypothetical protein VR72_14325 [Clostridiaceae bacterium BRH_c20a]